MESPNINTNRQAELVRMIPGGTQALTLAIIAAVLVTAAAWLWKRAQLWERAKYVRAWFWDTIHKRQSEQIAELRKDVDALLSVIDHWVTPGAGDKQRQFEYMAETLEARGKRGISGAYMRVASLIDDHGH